jgi:hypothetical protein
VGIGPTTEQTQAVPCVERVRTSLGAHYTASGWVIVTRRALHAHMYPEQAQCLESRHLESRPKASARLDIEVSAGWVHPLVACGVATLFLLFTCTAETECLARFGKPPRTRPKTAARLDLGVWRG